MKKKPRERYLATLVGGGSHDARVVEIIGTCFQCVVMSRGGGRRLMLTETYVWENDGNGGYIGRFCGLTRVDRRTWTRRPCYANGRYKYRKKGQ